MATIIIEKEGRQVMELVQDGGVCAIVKRYGHGAVHHVISAEKFASILDKADDNGCNIYDYYS